MSRVNDVDEVAVERAMQGEPLYLRPWERYEAVRTLTSRGCSARDIADRLHVAPRTVTRIRSRFG